MSSPLAAAIANLASAEFSTRSAGASVIYQHGCSLADEIVRVWRGDPALSALLGSEPQVTVGVAVGPATFSRIRQANGMPRLAQVPREQDALEFEMHFPEGVSLDVLTTSEPGGAGAIARYLSRIGEGIQQVEFRCLDVDRATAILRENFGATPIYPETRPGADGTRVNFFLMSTSSSGKVLIELYETPERHL